MREGAALGIKIDRLAQASLALEAATNWSLAADAVDTCDADLSFEERPSLEQVSYLAHQLADSSRKENSRDCRE